MTLSIDFFKIFRFETTEVIKARNMAWGKSDSATGYSDSIDDVWYEKTMSVKDLFAFQLLGNVVKIASWLYAYVMLAKAKALIFIGSEVIFSGMFVILTMLFVSHYGLVGVSYAFFVNYTIYFLFICWWFQKSCKQGAFDEVSV